jgi:hypothetical protein
MNTFARRKLVTAALAVCTIGASVLALAASPPLAHADDCGQWDFGQGNDFYQSNGWTMSFSGAPVNYPRTPSGGAIGRPSNDPVPRMHGSPKGRIDGNFIFMDVYWDNGSVGHYEGNVSSDGTASGTTYDKTHPGSTATWTSSPTFVCEP